MKNCLSLPSPVMHLSVAVGLRASLTESTGKYKSVIIPLCSSVQFLFATSAAPSFPFVQRGGMTGSSEKGKRIWRQKA